MTDILTKLVKELVTSIKSRLILMAFLITLALDVLLWLGMGVSGLPFSLGATASILIGAVVIDRLGVQRAQVDSARKVLRNHRERTMSRVKKMRAVVPEADTKDLFVEPNLLPDREEYGGCIRGGLLLRNVLRNARYKELNGIIIYGLAGSGKTTLLQWLTHTLVKREDPTNWEFLAREFEMDLTDRLPEWMRDLLECLGLRPKDREKRFPKPIFVRLENVEADLGNGQKADAQIILDILRQHFYDGVESGRKIHRDTQIQTKRCLASLDGLIDRGMIIPIFDGLDALSEPEQQVFLSSLASFLDQHVGNTPFVLTSRSRDSHPLERVEIWKIARFGAQQIQRYVEKYEKAKQSGDRGYDAIRLEAETGQAGRLWRAISTTAHVRPRVWDLVTNPMLLAMIARIFEPGQEDIPLDRQTIYKRYVKGLWRKRRDSKFGEVDLDQIQTILAREAMEALEERRPSLTAIGIRKLAPYRDELLDMLLLQKKGSTLDFAREMLRVYFASVHLKEYLIPSAANDDDTIPLRKATGQGLDSQVEARWAACWREALTFAVTALAREEADDGIDHASPLFRYIEWLCANRDDLPARILLLRLLGATSGHLPSLREDLAQEEALSWLAAYLSSTAEPLSPYWQRDVWESSDALQEEHWHQLGRWLSQRATRDRALGLVTNLRHEKVADLLIQLSRSEGTVLKEVRRTIHNLGLLAEIPLVRMYNRAVTEEDINSLLVAIELMGYAGYTNEISDILHKIANGQCDEIAQTEQARGAALRALGQWGQQGTKTLKRFLRDASDLSTSVQEGLVDGLTSTVLGDDLLAKMMYYLNRKGTRQQLTMRVLRNKINGEEYEAKYSRRFINKYLEGYQPDSQFRKILGYLDRRQMEAHSQKRQIWWVDRLLDLLKPLEAARPAFLQSLMDIYSGLENEIGFEWVMKALNDGYLGVRHSAIEAFVTRSVREDNPLERLYAVRHRIPTRVAGQIEKGILNAQISSSPQG